MEPTAHNPQMPYGVQQPPQPVYAPVSGKRPGSTSTKVWGIILLILGIIGLISIISTLAMSLGGVSGSAFTPGLDETSKQEMDQFVNDLVSSMLGRWTFWVNTVGEILIAVISIVAGFLLAIKPRPLGRSLAIGRAVLVLLLLPVYGMETTTAIEEQFAFQQRIMERAATREVRRSSSNANEAEVQRREREMQRAMDGMQPIMRGIGYGMMVAIVLGVLVINGLVLLFMTRPAVRTYLEEVAAEGDHSIPQYDPSMGIMTGPPPGTGPPQNTPGKPDGGGGPHSL